MIGFEFAGDAAGALRSKLMMPQDIGLAILHARVFISNMSPFMDTGEDEFEVKKEAVWTVARLKSWGFKVVYLSSAGKPAGRSPTSQPVRQRRCVCS